MSKMTSPAIRPSEALRAFGEAYRRRPEPPTLSPEVIDAIRAFTRSLQEAAVRVSRAVAQIAESAERMKDGRTP